MANHGRSHLWYVHFSAPGLVIAHRPDQSPKASSTPQLAWHVHALRLLLPAGPALDLRRRARRCRRRIPLAESGNLGCGA